MIALYEDSDIRIAGETVKDLGFMLHCTVSKWSSSVYRKALWILLKTAEEHRVVYGMVKDDKQKKFMETLGFTPCEKDVVSHSGTVYSTYKFEVNKWKQQ